MRIGGEIGVYDEDNFKGDHGDGNGNGNADDESTNGFQDEHEQAKLVGIQRRAWIWFPQPSILSGHMSYLGQKYQHVIYLQQLKHHHQKQQQ